MMSLKTAIRYAEILIIRNELVECDGKIALAAVRLMISRYTIYRKIISYRQIEDEETAKGIVVGTRPIPWSV